MPSFKQTYLVSFTIVTSSFSPSLWLKILNVTSLKKVLLNDLEISFQQLLVKLLKMVTTSKSFSYTLKPTKKCPWPSSESILVPLSLVHQLEGGKRLGRIKNVKTFSDGHSHLLFNRFQPFSSPVALRTQQP